MLKHYIIQHSKIPLEVGPIVICPFCKIEKSSDEIYNHFESEHSKHQKPQHKPRWLDGYLQRHITIFNYFLWNQIYM